MPTVGPQVQVGSEKVEPHEWLESKTYHVCMHLSPAMSKAWESTDAEPVNWFKLLFSIQNCAKVWSFLLWSSCGKIVLESQTPISFSARDFEHTSLNADRADAAVRIEGRLRSCKLWAPATHMCQEAGASCSLLSFHIHPRVDETLHHECFWSTVTSETSTASQMWSKSCSKNKITRCCCRW